MRTHPVDEKRIADLKALMPQAQARFRAAMQYSAIGKALLGVGIQGVRVDGHADSSGKAAYNQQLSERRAQSVARALVGVGMQAQNIQSRGLGSSPATVNQTRLSRDVSVILTVATAPAGTRAVS